MIPIVLYLAALLFAAPRNPGSEPLAQYLEAATLTWMALPDCAASPHACADFETRERETPAAVGARVHDYAQAVAEVAREGFDGAPIAAPYADDAGRARAGLLLMSLAFHESRFRGYVADGRCTDGEWRKSDEGRALMRLGTCDGGFASTVWQIHIGRGQRVGTELVTRERALEDPRAGAALALQLAGGSIRFAHSLRYYTGEGAVAPKAREREALATAYYRAHPFPGIVSP